MNNYNDFIIACDMDDTIEQLLQAWIQWLNNKYNYSVKYSDIKDWKMSISFPELSHEQLIEPLLIEEFWLTVNPMRDAIVYIKKLIEEGFPFYIVTSSHPKNVLFKSNFLDKYFPFIDKNNVIIIHKKQLIRCTVLIDDGTHNIVGPYIGILKDSTHNRNFNENDFPHIYRGHCWKEIYEIIHQLADRMEV